MSPPPSGRRWRQSAAANLVVTAVLAVLMVGPTVGRVEASQRAPQPAAATKLRGSATLAIPQTTAGPGDDAKRSRLGVCLIHSHTSFLEASGTAPEQASSLSSLSDPQSLGGGGEALDSLSPLDLTPTPGGPNLPPKNIPYHGGPVLHNPISIYLVWYGSWKESQKSIVRGFIRSLGDESMKQTPDSAAQLWNVAQLFYDSEGNHVSGEITLGVRTIALALHWFWRSLFLE